MLKNLQVMLYHLESKISSLSTELVPTRSLKRTSFCQKLTSLEQIVDSFMPKESTNNPQPKLDLSYLLLTQYRFYLTLSFVPPTPLDHSQHAKFTTYNSSHTQSRNSSSNKTTFQDPLTKLILGTRKATSEKDVVAVLLALGYDDHSFVVDI